MSNVERKPGYYRVKVRGVWKIAEWEYRRWWLFGIEDNYRDSDFHAIDETPIDHNPPAPDDNLNNQLKSSEIF